MNKVLLAVLAVVVLLVGVIVSRTNSSSTTTNSEKTLGDSTQITEPETTLNDMDGGEDTAMDTTTTSFKMEDTQVGTGKEAKLGNTITVHYRGKLTNGTVFDESYKRGEPFKFVLGSGQVIQGWEQGFTGMKEGGKRRLTIPSEMGYGSRGAGGVIPPNATLIFDVELLKVE